MIVACGDFENDSCCGYERLWRCKVPVQGEL
jgi:hypothetical protein